jgi:hypothetical protein
MSCQVLLPEHVLCLFATQYSSVPVYAPDSAREDHAISRKQGTDYQKRFEGKFLTKKTITPELIARFLVILFSIIHDCSPEWMEMLVLACKLTLDIPLASLTLSQRFAVIDRSAFKGAANAATKCFF